MYDQFYKFLTNIIIEFLEQAELRSGAKFDIRLPDEEEVKGLYHALTETAVAEKFTYQAEGQGAYETFALHIGDIKVILASTAMKVTDAFLTALRNKVGTEEELFRNTAILFIHDSTLDSILNGSESLQKIGMPLHISNIQRVVELRLKEGDYSLTVKRVLQFVMANKEGKNIDIRNALVEYREILEVLNQGRIDSRQYNEFGLFYDSSLEQISDAEIKERLKENAKYYGIIFNYRQFNTKDSILERSFTRKNMESIDSNYWNTLDYTELHKWIEKNKNKQPIEYLSSDQKKTEEGLIYWEASEKDTAVGRRTLNLIVFNPDHLSQISLRFKFNQVLSIKNCQITKGSELEVQMSGRQMKVTLIGKHDCVSYGRLKYKDVKDYNFKILVVPIAEDVLKEIKPYYKLPTKLVNKGIYIEPFEEVICLNSKVEEVKYVELKQQGQEVNFSLDKSLTITNAVVDEESDVTNFVLKQGNLEIPMFIKGGSVKPRLITAVKLSKLRRESEQNFTYHYNVEENSLKLYQDTTQFYAADELLERIKMEIQLIETGKTYYTVNEEYALIGEVLELPEQIQEAYNALIAYYRQNQTLPSLATLTTEVIQLMESYVKVYTETIENIENGEILKEAQRNLSRLGNIVIPEKEEIYWTPLHPMNIVYELQRQKELQCDEVDEQVLKRIKPLGLVPFIKDEDGKLYQGKEISELTWLKFVACTSEASNGKYGWAKIVEKNIVSFTTHFAYLFDKQGKRPLKINLIGTDGTEVLLGGLLRVVGCQLKKGGEESLTPIEVKIYTKNRSKNIFHELEYDSFNAAQFLQNFDVDYDTKEYSVQEFMKVFRSKLSVYQIENNNYASCHISFVGLTGDEKVSYRNSDEVLASSYLGGMINAPTVYLEEGHYVKTVGLKGLIENLFTRTIRAVNALAYVGMSSTPFDARAALATVTDHENIKDYDLEDQRAIWTVYLDPKVNYSYFSQSEEVLIHYVDRLYAPSMIDAITLSHQTNSYKKAIQNKIQALSLSQPEESLGGLMKLSNLLNGEWLIELLSTKKTMTLESINNPLLIRWSTELLNQEAFTWVPVSLHEFMRTCESVGIKSSKGLLKNRSYERLINDIIWVGYAPERSEVCFYPISLRKAKNEVGVFKELSENIYDQSFEGRYFRQLLVERGLFNLKELIGAELFIRDLGEILLAEPVQSKFLQGNFKVVSANPERLGDEAKIIFANKEEVEITYSRAGLTIFMDQKKLWQNELRIKPEVVEVVTTLESTTSSETGKIDESRIEERNEADSTPVKFVEKEVDVEQWSHEARYSIVQYFEELPTYTKELMDFYILKGIKVFLILNMNRKTFSNMIGQAALEKYEELMRKQVFSITYDANIVLEEKDEAYIIDGEVHDEGFYNQLKKTNFNREQYEIEHEKLEHSLSIKAGAGTGKTKVMIDRIMYIKHMDRTISLAQIAMITFTNESMVEMRRRLAGRLTTYYEMTQDRKYLIWMDELNEIKINTIHSFAMEILKCIGNEIGIVNLQITGYKYQKDRLIEKAIDEFRKEYSEDYKTIQYIPQYSVKKVIKELENFLDNRTVIIDTESGNIDFGKSMMGYEKLFKYVIEYVSRAIQEEKIESGKYEINDLIKMLRNIKEVEHIENKINLKYIMVDEFQDTDEVQVEFIAWLAEKLQAILFVVGDIKQSIYRFRGADYTAFDQVKKKAKNKLIDKYITKNYRTTKGLVKDFNKIFMQISEEVDTFNFDQDSSLQATKDNGSNKGLETVLVSDDESKYIKIKELYYQHIQEGTICVLARTNAQVNKVVQMLEQLKIPSIAEIKGDFYRQPAIRDFYLLVRMLIHTERFEEWILLEQSTYGPQRVSNAEVIHKYQTDTSHARLILQDMPWYKQMVQKAKVAQKSLPLKVIREIIEEQKPHLKYARSYYRHLKSEGLRPEELVDIARYKGIEYEANLNHLLYLLQKEFTDQTMTLIEIEKYLKFKILTDKDQDRITLVDHELTYAVRVMTVHKAKGLEFNTVILPFTNENKMTNFYRNQFILGNESGKYQLGFKVHLKQDQEETHNDHYSKLVRDEHSEIVGEETRLLYVACTRAEQHLYAFVEQLPARNRRINSWQDLLVKGGVDV